MPKEEGIVKILWNFSLGVTGNVLSADTEATLRKTKRRLGMDYDWIVFTGGIFSPQTGQTIPVSRLMADKVGAKGDNVLILINSTITRTDVKEGVEALKAKGIDLKSDKVFVDVVSEKWHLYGIKILLGRHFRWGNIALHESGYWPGFKMWVGRVLRLAYYLISPEGTDGLAAGEKGRRS